VRTIRWWRQLSHRPAGGRGMSGVSPAGGEGSGRDRGVDVHVTLGARPPAALARELQPRGRQPDRVHAHVHPSSSSGFTSGLIAPTAASRRPPLPLPGERRHAPAAPEEHVRRDEVLPLPELRRPTLERCLAHQGLRALTIRHPSKKSALAVLARADDEAEAAPLPRADLEKRLERYRRWRDLTILSLPDAVQALFRKELSAVRRRAVSRGDARRRLWRVTPTAAEADPRGGLRGAEPRRTRVPGMTATAAGAGR
jgi:hypothetical protein